MVGRLKAYEERIHDEEDEKQEEQGQDKLMYTDSQPEQERYESGRGIGRGGRYGNRGRGRGRYGYQQNGYGYYWQERDASKVECFQCDKIEHFAQNCPDRLLKLQETQEVEDKTQEAEELMMQEVVLLNERNCMPSMFESSSAVENLWYLDNGASNHMTDNLTYFSKLGQRVTGKVKFGDDSKIDIKGKGSILFATKNGERKILSDVYYIPDLKSNIIIWAKPLSRDAKLE